MGWIRAAKIAGKMSDVTVLNNSQHMHKEAGMCCMLCAMTCDRHHAVLCEVFSCTSLYCYINLTEIVFS